MSPLVRSLRNRRRHFRRTLTALLLAIALPAAQIQAGQITWNGGGGTGNWGTGTNWQGGSPPVSGTDTLLFSGTTQTATVNNIGAFTTAITFGNDGTAGKDSAFTISGSALTLNGPIPMSAVTGTALTDTINSNLVLGAQRNFTTGNNHNLTVTGTISGAGGINKDGAALLMLSGANTFTGAVNINRGTVSVGTVGTTGATSNLGQNGLIRIGITQANGDGTLTITGSGESTNKQIQIGNGAAVTAFGNATITSNGTGAVTFTNGSFNALDGTATVARTLTLSGAATSGTNTISGVIANNNTAGGGTVNVAKEGDGTWRLDGANTFTGQARVNNGTLIVTSIGTTGAASNLGANGTIRIGNLNDGNLLFLGAGETTDKRIQIGVGSGVANTGGATITSSGSGALTFSNAAFNARDTFAAVARTLTLDGAVTSGTNTISGVIADNNTAGGGTVGVTKNGATTWILSGTSTYTGPTTVSAGTLLVNGALTGTGAVDVASAGTLGGIGSIAGATAVSGSLAPGNSGAGILTLNSLTLSGTSTTLIDILGTGRGTGYDGLNINSSGGLTYGGTLSINFGSLFSDSTTFHVFDFLGASSGGFSSVTSTGSYAGT